MHNRKKEISEKVQRYVGFQERYHDNLLPVLLAWRKSKLSHMYYYPTVFIGVYRTPTFSFLFLSTIPGQSDNDFVLS